MKNLYAERVLVGAALDPVGAGAVAVEAGTIAWASPEAAELPAAYAGFEERRLGYRSGHPFGVSTRSR